MNKDWPHFLEQKENIKLGLKKVKFSHNFILVASNFDNDKFKAKLNLRNVNQLPVLVSELNQKELGQKFGKPYSVMTVSY